MNKLFSIICYVVAGFFIYTTSILAFVNMPPVAAKFVLMGAFAVVAAVCLLIGLRASRYSDWQRDVGVVFLSAALFTLFLVLCVACMLATPEFMQQFPDNKFHNFSDYVTGSLHIVTFLALGCLLIWRSRRRNTNVA